MGLHVAAALVFVAGVFSLSVFMATLPRAGPLSDEQRAAAALIKAGDRLLTTPAVILVFGLGVWLAALGAWYREPWFWVKVTLALILSAIHGVQSGSLRKLAAGASPGDLRFRPSPPWLVAAMAATIAMLVVVKPI